MALAQTQLHVPASIQKHTSRNDIESLSNGSRVTTLTSAYFAELNRAAAAMLTYSDSDKITETEHMLLHVCAEQSGACAKG